MSGLVGVVIVVLIGIIAPLLLNGPATKINTLDIYASPSSHHLLGTDSLGRDVLARVLVATRLSLEVGALAALVAFVLGVALGVVIVGSGGRARSVLLRTIDTGIAIPGLLLALLIATIIGVGVKSVVLGIGIAGSFGFARITSTLALSVAGREYVQAARTMGIRGWRLVVRYLLPNMAEPMIIFLGVAVGSSIPYAVVHAVYAQVNAEMEMNALRLGQPKFLNPYEAKRVDRIDRVWEVWSAEAQGKIPPAAH